MDTSTMFPGWDWEDPEGLAPRLEGLLTDLSVCKSLEAVGALPRERAELVALGITGIEFAAFKTAHASGLGSDILSMRCGDETSSPGPLYRVDGESYFTELDITAPLPFADGSLEWVYAEHLIEHVPLPAAVGWLAEIRRVLVPGGLVRVTTPDLAIYVNGYADGDPFYSRHRRRLNVMRAGPPMPERKAFMFNQIFYHFGHRWIYDLEELRHVLRAAGFDTESIHPVSFRAGERQDVADLDTNLRRDESIYVEAVA
jgi:predicted SAM-dependent methyltransferase